MRGKKVFLGNGTNAHYTGEGIQLSQFLGNAPKQVIFLDSDMLNRLDHFKHLILKWIEGNQKNEKLQSGRMDSDKNTSEQKD